MQKLYTSISVLFLFFFSAETRAQKCISGDCLNGVGTYQWENLDEYTGQFVNGELTGLGCFDWANGAYYYGHLYKGTLDGLGIYLGLEAKDDLLGIFTNGKLTEARTFSSSGCLLGNCSNGVGVYLWENDDIFIGEWSGGNRNGYGRYDWADGSNYVGYIKNGLLHGWGDYIATDKTHMTGQFLDNVFQQ